jgi:hypothetical protein
MAECDKNRCNPGMPQAHPDSAVEFRTAVQRILTLRAQAEQVGVSARLGIRA